jgi:Methylase involved in ubiquinone/menaquinone biosynthesis
MNISSKMIEDVWNRHAENYDKKHNASENKEHWKKILKNLIGGDVKKKVLDIGTGTGFLALLTAEIGYNSTGIDLAAKMIEAAQVSAQVKHLKVEFLPGNWDALPFKDNSYDVIVNRCILWTVFRPENTLREWRRVLKPGGSLLCFCPACFKSGSVVPSHYEDEVEAMLPLKGALPDELCKVIASCGYHETEAIVLPDLGNNELFSDWYVIKSIKY